MSKYKIKDLADEISERVNDPKKSGFDKFIGLEHYTSGEARITRFGSTANLDSSAKIFHSGDILIARRNVYLKRAGIVDFDGLTSGDSIVIRAKNDTIRQILSFIFNTEQFWDFATQFADGSMSKRLSPKILMEYEINLSDDEKEREKLAKTLWAINDTLDSYKEMLKQSDELVKAKFVEMFDITAKEVKLTDYVWFQEGPGVRSVDFADEGTILLTGSNINNNKISFGYNSDRYVSTELSGGKYAHFMCDKDDILAVTSAITPSKFDEKIAVVEEDKKYCLNTGIIRFKPNLKYLTSEYFKEFLKSDYFKSQVSAKMTGVCQMHFGPSHLKKMTLLLPNDINEQIKFGKFTDNVNKSKSSLQKCITKLESMYKKIVNKYLTKEE